MICIVLTGLEQESTVVAQSLTLTNVYLQCNNPRTKEPKLEAAARIVPEWTDYDQEIKLLWDRVYGTLTQQARKISQIKKLKVGLW